MKSIGGYFELELNRGALVHREAMALNSARNCLKLLLLSRKAKVVYVPYYTCEVVVQTLQELDVKITFYNIDRSLEIESVPELGEKEVLLYTNYFGIKDTYIRNLAEKYGKSLIIDNAQAFFSTPIPGISTFYSPRKFFGVSDGGFLYSDMEIPEYGFLEHDISYNRMLHLLKRSDVSAEYGFGDFQENERALDSAPIRRMSVITRKILDSIDYRAVCRQRIKNFKYVHSFLGEFNRLPISHDSMSVPMVYPFLHDNSIGLVEYLQKNKVYVARYWPNVLEWCDKVVLEYTLASTLISVPIDQRYTQIEMSYIISLILKYIKK